ncbi:hypothetical protein D1872_59970 [compost metagenome]
MAQPVRLERCAPNGIKAIFLFPYFGVATMIGIPGRRSAYNRGGELVYTSISLHLSHTLIRHSLPTLIMCIAGVPEGTIAHCVRLHCPSILHDCQNPGPVLTPLPGSSSERDPESWYDTNI